MQRAYRDAMETKVAKDNAEREEEEEMRKIMMAKFAGKKRRRERRITVAIVFREHESCNRFPKEAQFMAVKYPRSLRSDTTELSAWRNDVDAALEARAIPPS